MKIFEKTLILASKSPRRSQLLREAGFQFVIKTKDIDESFSDKMDVRKVAKYLAEKKAKGCADFLEKKEDILLAADSTVVCGDKIYNKPEDRDDAIRMLTELSGKKHTVYTGVCLLSKSKKKAFTGKSDVWFDELTKEEIEWYIDTCQPYDKAGSYGIQEWMGHCKIKKISGTNTNIMGLPVDLVYKYLNEWED